MAITVAVVSDTHLPRGDRALSPACLDRLRAADLVLHAGDVATREVLAALEALGPPVLAVAGNVDEPALQRPLPVTREVEEAGVPFQVCNPGSPTDRRREPHHTIGVLRVDRAGAGCELIRV